MAERGSVAMWLKKYLSGAMGAVTIAIATITALTVSTIAVQSGGSLVIDASGDVTLSGSGLAKASGSESLTLSVLGTGDLVLSSADDLTLTASGDDIVATATDAVALSGVTMTVTGSTSAAILANGGSNYTQADAAGVTMSVNGAGDDIALSSVDDITISNLSGDDISISAGDAVTVASSSAAGGSLTCDSTGVTIGAASAGDDFSISAADDGQVSAGDQLLLSGVTSSRIESDASANFLQCSATGVTITAGAAGDDISLVTTGGDDLLLTIADDITGTFDAATLTAVTSVTGQVTGGGAVNLTTGGSNLLANNTGDDISITADDDVSITAFTGPLLLIGANGQLQVDSNGLTVNTPAQAALVLSGTAYRLSSVVRVTTADFTPAGTSEEAADSFTVPANAFGDGETLHIRIFGTAAANTNSKIWQARIHATTCTSGTSLGSVDFNVATDTNWTAEWFVTRTGSNAQDTTFVARSGGAAGTFALDATTTSAITDTATLVVCVTATNATAAADSTMTNAYWEWL